MKLRLLILFALLAIFLGSNAYAQGRGAHFVSDCDLIKNPEANATWCFNTTDGTVTYYDGASFSVPTNLTSSPTLQTVYANGKAVTGANSQANCVRIGDSTNYWCIYWDVTAGFIVETSPTANARQRIPTNKTGGFYDEEGASDIFTIDPDAASANAMYPFATGYRPRKSVWLPAGTLHGDGTQCPSDPSTVTIGSGAPRQTFICTDNDAATLYGEVVMPDAWDGGTITVKHLYIQTAADTGALNGDVAAACRLSGATINNTWGTEIAIDDAAVTGSSGSDITESAAVTPNGTCTAGVGRLLQIRYQLDATGTTTAVATLHHVGFLIEYTVSSLSD